MQQHQNSTWAKSDDIQFMIDIKKKIYKSQFIGFRRFQRAQV